MRKIFPAFILAASVITILLIHSCSKNIVDSYTEPITIVKPDSLNVMYVKRGTVQPINIQFTTDRPILWAKCMYEVDSPGAAGSFTFPDTLFYKVLDTIPSQLSNKYNYLGSFTVPDSNVTTLTVVRFDVKFKAALNPSSPDTVSYEKQFKMTIQ